MNTHAVNRLPVKGSLASIFAGSALIAILTALVSILSLLYPAVFYPTDELALNFIPTDVVILLVGVPMLLGSMWSARRGRLLGLLFWPGALFFGLYNHIAYVFALPLTWGFLAHLALTVLSIYTLLGLMACMDGNAVREHLRGSVYERLCGGIVAGFGTIFLLRVLFVLVNVLAAEDSMAVTELAANVSDFLVGPAFVFVGIALWKRKALGYMAGLGLLFQASMLFVGLIIFLLLQPMLTPTPFSLVDVLMVMVLWIICSIPLALFIRGAAQRRASLTGGV
jgi:hypothetical protein